MAHIHREAVVIYTKASLDLMKVTKTETKLFLILDVGHLHIWSLKCPPSTNDQLHIT